MVPVVQSLPCQIASPAWLQGKASCGSEQQICKARDEARLTTAPIPRISVFTREYTVSYSMLLFLLAKQSMPIPSRFGGFCYLQSSMWEAVLTQLSAPAVQNNDIPCSAELHCSWDGALLLSQR